MHEKENFYIATLYFEVEIANIYEPICIKFLHLVFFATFLGNTWNLKVQNSGAQMVGKYCYLRTDLFKSWEMMFLR